MYSFADKMDKSLLRHFVEVMLCVTVGPSCENVCVTTCSQAIGLVAAAVTMTVLCLCSGCGTSGIAVHANLCGEPVAVVGTAMYK